MAIRKQLELKTDTVLFNVYKVDNDRLNILKELPQIKSGNVNLEMTFNHIERDELTISFKNYDDYLSIKNVYKDILDGDYGADIVLEFLLFDDKTQNYKPINLYYMTGFNEVYNGNSEWEVSITGTDWKGFIEERRLIPHNVIDTNPDNPDFDKIRFTLNENMNDKVLPDLLNEALKNGRDIAKGKRGAIVGDRKVKILNNMFFELKEDSIIPRYLQDKCYISDFRKQWNDMCFGGLDYAYNLDRIKVTTKKNNDKIDLFYKAQNVHFVDYKNSKSIINKIEITNDKSDYKNNACVYSEDKDSISYTENAFKPDTRIATFDSEITDAGYNPEAPFPLQTLATKASQEISTNTNTLSFSADIELSGLPLVDWEVGDIISFKNFPISINGAFEITSVQLSANHDNGYLEFSINETLERPNVFRQNDLIKNEKE